MPGAALVAALRAAMDNGTPPPCTGRYRGAWTSDDPAERAIAADLCGPCPITTTCRNAADEHDERHHVWGGRDYTRTTSTSSRIERAAS